jgi:hypothetical protein
MWAWLLRFPLYGLFLKRKTKPWQQSLLHSCNASLSEERIWKVLDWVFLWVVFERIKDRNAWEASLRFRTQKLRELVDIKNIEDIAWNKLIDIVNSRHFCIDINRDKGHYIRIREFQYHKVSWGSLHNILWKRISAADSESIRQTWKTSDKGKHPLVPSCKKRKISLIILEYLFIL